MSLEKQRLELGLLKIAAATAELELKKAERLEDIKRIDTHIELQKQEEAKIRKKIEELEEK